MPFLIHFHLNYLPFLNSTYKPCKSGIYHFTWRLICQKEPIKHGASRTVWTTPFALAPGQRHVARTSRTSRAESSHNRTLIHGKKRVGKQSATSSRWGSGSSTRGRPETHNRKDERLRISSERRQTSHLENGKPTKIIESWKKKRVIEPIGISSEMKNNYISSDKGEIGNSRKNINKSFDAQLNNGRTYAYEKNAHVQRSKNPSFAGKDESAKNKYEKEFPIPPKIYEKIKNKIPISVRPTQLPKLARFFSKRKPTPVSKKTRGFIPAKFKLLPIKSDLRQTNLRLKGSYQLSDMDESPLTKLKNRDIEEMTIRTNISSFEGMGLLPEVLEAVKKIVLKNIKDPKPTEIQALAIPEIIKTDEKDFLCAAETGSGKTLAYLLPIINKLKVQEKSEIKEKSVHDETPASENFEILPDFETPTSSRKVQPVRRLNRPRAIVLLPSRELVDQVHFIMKQLSVKAILRTIRLTSHMYRNNVRRELDHPPDMVVATPAGILEYTKNGILSFADTRYVVVDEADTMFEPGFEEDVKEVITNVKNSCRNQNRQCQVIAVCATLPKTINQAISQEFPNMIKISTSSLHKTLPKLRQTFVDMHQFNSNKHLALLDLLKNNREQCIMVFCNTRKSAMNLEAFLLTRKIPVIGLYKDVEGREEKLKMFRSSDPDARILICTDIASRGIDTTFVQHVVLYEFPTTVVDYLHRIGRTARAGKSGQVTCFITRKDRTLADRIKRNVRDNKVLS
ncbi:hypothetical protein G9A89_013341 [Geosiphon pyriformis]|nr:hypothetical protein G9A89_013341 [Geosiphon pyriformis]